MSKYQSDRSAHCILMLKLKNSTSSRSKESPDPLLIWHRSHCQGVKLTMNSAAAFLFNQHDSLLNTSLPLLKGIVLQMCYISRFTLLRVLAYNKQRGLCIALCLDNLPVWDVSATGCCWSWWIVDTQCAGDTGCGPDWCRPDTPAGSSALMHKLYACTL